MMQYALYLTYAINIPKLKKWSWSNSNLFFDKEQLRQHGCHEHGAIFRPDRKHRNQAG